MLASDKLFGMDDMGQRELEENITLDREGGS
jgi:hypothetical protein